MDVRRLRSDDRSQWELLWQDYLVFYEHELDDATTEQTWSRLVGDGPALVGLGASKDEELVGICHLVFHPSTWSVSSYCYLEDLFVRPDQRGGGVGRALIGAARDEAQVAGASKLYWQTHLTNDTARRLYDRVAEHRGFVVYEVDVDG
jgi:GNAT superfamily N-acetyltransferase